MSFCGNLLAHICTEEVFYVVLLLLLRRHRSVIQYILRRPPIDDESTPNFNAVELLAALDLNTCGELANSSPQDTHCLSLGVEFMESP